MNRITQILTKVIQLESTPDNQEAILECLKIIGKVLLKQGINSSIGKNGNKYFLISDSPNTRLLLLGHVDVVPGDKNLFTPRILETRCLAEEHST